MFKAKIMNSFNTTRKTFFCECKRPVQQLLASWLSTHETKPQSPNFQTGILSALRCGLVSVSLAVKSG